jgi:hypothetical protein
MSNEIKVGDWTVTEEGLKRLKRIRLIGFDTHRKLSALARECVDIFGICVESDESTSAIDICEEIVLHGTPVEEVVAKLQRHLEGGR